MKFKSRKLKYMLLGAGIISVAAILPSTLLISCSSSGNRPYGPWTVLNLNGNETKLRYNTKYGTVEFYNNSDTNNNIFDNNEDYLNEWVDINDVRDKYLEISNNNVKNYLDNNIDAIINAHQIPNNPATNIDKEKIKNDYYESSFMYGVQPTEQQKNLAYYINSMSILGSLFIGVNTFVSNLISYVINSEFTQTLNNLLSDETYLDTIFNLSHEISSSERAKQFFVGSGMGIGSGDSTYHLWASSFDATISPVTNKSEINSPYNYYQDGGNNTVYAGQIPVSASNIVINYQWYKASKNGGHYVKAEEAMDNWTDEQKDTFTKLGIKVLKNGFQFSISNITFNLMPESYAYTDPLLTNIVDYVNTGLYNVMPQVQKQNVCGEMNNKILYPNYLATNDIKWRLVNSESKKNRYSPLTLGQNLYYDINKNLNGAEFNNDGIKQIPFYTLNNQWTSMGEGEEDNDNDYGYSSLQLPELNLGYKDINYISKTFIDPFYNEDGDRNVANNHNDLAKSNYIHLWLLGYLAKDNIPIDQITSNYNELNKISPSKFLRTSNNELKAFNEQFQQGLSTYYSIVNFRGITDGYYLNYNNDNQIVEEQ